MKTLLKRWIGITLLVMTLIAATGMASATPCCPLPCLHLSRANKTACVPPILP